MKSPSDIAARYLSGFGNHFASEALPGALPQGRNSPQRCAYGLYAEQFSGTAFTAPRHANRRSWLYRIRPAAVHGKFRKVSGGRISNRFDAAEASPNRLRWRPPRCRARRPTSSPGLPPWAATARRSCTPAAPSTGMSPTAPCAGASSTMPTGSC